MAQVRPGNRIKMNNAVMNILCMTNIFNSLLCSTPGYSGFQPSRGDQYVNGPLVFPVLIEKHTFTPAVKITSSYSRSWQQFGSSERKRGYSKSHNPLIYMVGGTGIEPVTSTV